MKSRFIVLLTALLTTSLLIGCGTESTANKQIETATATTTEESTSEQTEEVTEEPSEEVLTEAETTESTETAEAIDESESSEASEPEQATEAPVDEAVESEASVPEFTFTEVSKTLYATQSVNVRSGPSTDFDKIGSLSTNQEIQVISRCNETGWYKFIWTDGSEVCVSNKYLADEKVEKPAASETSSNGGNSTAGTGSTASSNYETGVWIDMGDYYFIIPNSEDEYWNYFNNCDDIRATLQARYPDRNTYVSSDASGSILIVSALHRNEKGFPNWSEINYIPELGMN